MSSTFVHQWLKKDIRACDDDWFKQNVPMFMCVCVPICSFYPWNGFHCNWSILVWTNLSPSPNNKVLIVSKLNSFSLWAHTHTMIWSVIENHETCFPKGFSPPPNFDSRVWVFWFCVLSMLKQFFVEKKILFTIFTHLFATKFLSFMATSLSW